MKSIANRYELGDAIGQGGMGTVYRGRDTLTNQVVAIKALSTSGVAEDYQEALTRFIREGEVLRQLNHPNIVDVLATVDEKGQQYIVMELVTGGVLADLLLHGELSITQTVNIALELSDALSRAHHLNIIHRDIKPANVLLADDGTPRLSDFGIAHITGQRRVTETGNIVGTLSYISPELLRSHPPSPASDIWAFGVMLFEMLTRVRPYDQANPVATIHAIVAAQPPDLEKMRPDTPVALVDLVYRMLQKNPDMRIPSMRLVGAELEAIKQGRPSTIAFVTQRPPTATIMADGPTTSFRTAETVARARKRNHTLPHQSTPFVGREQEVAELVTMLKNDAVTIVTIMGPGGMGKTRLSLQVAESLVDEFEHGVHFVPLASLASPEQIVTAIAEVLRINFSGGQSPREQVLDYLSNKSLLLVFDNFEHVVEGAGLIADIIQRAPLLKVLVTSRSKLNLRGENTYSIAGMAVPKTDLSLRQAVDEPSIQLFLQSARRSQPAFELTEQNLPWVLRICKSVEGMPLAIELAAAWVEMLDVNEISAEIEQSLDFLESEMRDMPDRHRSIRSVFDYSWELMSEDERQSFVQLSIFRGGFHRDAAQQVTGVALRGLQALVNKSLIHRDAHGRYTVHEVLRQYAAEALNRNPDLLERLLDQHMHYYAHFLEGQEDNLKGRQQTEATLAIEQEMQNIRMAWGRAVEQANFEVIGLSLESLNRFYDMLTLFDEGEQVFREATERLAPLAQTEAERLTLGRLMARLGWFARRIRSGEEARRITLESITILNEANATPETAFPLNTLGCIARDDGNHAEAMRFIRDSLVTYRDGRDKWGVGFTLFELGDSSRVLENYSDAERFLKESITVCQAIGDQNGVAWAYIRLGQMAQALGDYDNTRHYFSEALTIAKGMGIAGWVLIETLQRLGWLEWRYMEDFQAALRHFEEAHTIIHNYGTKRQMAVSLSDLGIVHASMGHVRLAREYFNAALQSVTSTNSSYLVLKTLVGMAYPLALSAITLQEDQLIVVEWLAYVRQHRAATVDLVTLAEDYLRTLRSGVPAILFDEAYRKGQHASLEDISASLHAILAEGAD